MVNDLAGPWDGFCASLDQCEESALAYVENLNEKIAVHLGRYSSPNQKKNR